MATLLLGGGGAADYVPAHRRESARLSVRRRHGAHQRSARHDEDSLIRPRTLRDVTERRGVLRVTERRLRQSLQAVVVVRYFLVFPIIKLNFSS